MAQRIRIRTMQNLQLAPVLSNGSYNLAGADLQNAHLNGAELIGADLSGANLTRAAFIDVDLSGANLTGAKLISANLAHANLSGANLTRADLTRANTTGAKLDDNTILQDAVLDRTYGVINIRSVAERELERRELQRIQHATTPWVEDTDCEKDAIDIINTFEIIPEGRRFKFENDRKAQYKTCYDVESLAQMVKHHRESRSRTELKTPLSQFKFTEKDIRRIEDYMRHNPIGGKKRKTYKKTNKRKAKKVTRKKRRKQNKK